MLLGVHAVDGGRAEHGGVLEGVGGVAVQLGVPGGARRHHQALGVEEPCFKSAIKTQKSNEIVYILHTV